MNISKRRLFALLSLCLLASVGSARGDENNATKAPESYQLQVFFGGLFPQNLPPQIMTLIQVESPFKARFEEAIPTLKSPTATAIYEASGTLHAPQNGKFKLDYKFAEMSTPDGAGLGYEGSLDLTPGKSIGHYSSAGIVRGFRVLLTKAKDGTTPNADPQVLPVNHLIDYEASWGKEEAGIQLGFGASSSFFEMMSYLNKRLKMGDTANFQLLVRNNGKWPVTVALSGPRNLGPIVVDSEGKSYSYSLPTFDGVPLIAPFRTGTAKLEAGQAMSLGTLALHLRPLAKDDLFPSLQVPRGKYRLSYKHQIRLTDADGKQVDLDLTTGEREFILVGEAAKTKEPTP